MVPRTKKFAKFLRSIKREHCFILASNFCLWYFIPEQIHWQRIFVIESFFCGIMAKNRICPDLPKFLDQFLPYIQILKTRLEKIAVKVYNTYMKLIKAEFTNVEELNSFQVDKSPSFSFSSSLKPFRMLSRLLCTLLNLWSVSTIRLDSWEIQKLVQNTPSFNPYSCVTCYNPCPIIKIYYCRWYTHAQCCTANKYIFWSSFRNNTVQILIIILCLSM